MLKTTPNRVIVRPILDTTKVKDKFILNPRFDQQANARRIVEVVAVCDKLTFTKHKIVNSNECAWETDIELKAGDIAWVTPFAMIENETKQIDKFEYNGEMLYVLWYRDFVAVKRDNVPIVVNGYLLLEEIAQPTKETKIVLPTRMNHIEAMLKRSGDEYIDECAETLAKYDDQPMNIRCIVRYAGKPNKSYKDHHIERMKAHYTDDHDLNVGDEVDLDVKYAGANKIVAYLEDSKFACFEGEKMFIVKQRKDIKYKHIKVNQNAISN